MLSQSDLRKAIAFYLKRKFTQYAILIDGEWGVGKTHLLTRIILPEIEDIRFYSISLYGLSTISEIENELYKCLSLPGNDFSPNGAQPEGFSGDLLRGAKLGGVSFAVQYLMRKVQEHYGEDCTLVLCFDDLERWSGHLNVCFSYVNKLAEQENLKCILLGNTCVLDHSGQEDLAKAREKTIRHIYRFETRVDERIKIALSLIDYRSDTNKNYISGLFAQNRQALIAFLSRIEEKNIRTLSEAIQLFEYILDRHFSTFEKAGNLPFTYFLTLLSSLVLFKKYLLQDKVRHALVDSSSQNINSFQLLTKIGYFEKEAPSHITAESKILLDTIFYRLDEISLSGVFSIIDRGFYIEKDFSGNFDRWTGAHTYETYLDKYYFYQLEEDQALSLINQVIELVFEKQAITNPATLLLLAERLSDDISKGVLDSDTEDYMARLESLLISFYDSGKMEAMDLGFLETQSHRYIKCDAVFQMVIKRNREYFANYQQMHHRGFWERIATNPEQISEMFKRMPNRDFIFDLEGSDEVLKCAESLSNAQLVTLTQELIDANRAEEADQSYSYGYDADMIQSIAETIYNKYQHTLGVRAANMRELASVIASF